MYGTYCVLDTVQFERLEAISSLEEERMMAMQRLEAKIEAKIGNIKNELLEIVDEDYRERRAKVDQNFSERRRAKGAAAAAAPAPITTDGKGAGGKDHKVELNGEGEGAQAQMASKETAGVVGDRV